jgi:Protein of unknown function (DUF4232)
MPPAEATVVTPPELSPDDLEALIRDARERQRRRRIVGVAIVLVTAASGLVAFAVLSNGPQDNRAAHGGSVPLASVPRCRSGDLHLLGRFDGAGTGQVRNTFTFINVSAARCTLRGWPSLRLVLPRHGFAVARLIRRTGANRPLLHRSVVLRPGGAASFEALSSDGIGLSRPCRGGREVVVTPPGGHVPIRLAFRGMAYCGRGYLWVAPLVAGRTDHHWF